MSTSAGPDITTDGLVFGYDTGHPIANNTTSTRFYTGKPTTNLLTQTGAQSLDTRSDIYNNTTKTDLGGGKYRFVNDGTGASTVRLYANLNDLTNGNTYGSSLSYEQFTGTSFSIDWCDSSTTAFSKSTYGTANRVKMSGARSTYTSTYRFMDINLPTNSSIVLFDAQIEEGVSSPFTSTSRSSTQGLLDLAGTTEIDLTNVSFDSNAQLTFDGTDDGINLGDNEIFDFTNGVATIEAIVKFPSSWTGGSKYPNLISKGGSAGWDTDGWALYGFRDWPNSGQKSWGFAMRNGSTVRNTTRSNITVDEYLHIVITIDGTTIRLYENGVQVTTNSQTINPASTSTNVYLGRGPSSQFFPGELPISKVYNITLSADEIKQNFNAYKKRFGI